MELKIDTTNPNAITYCTEELGFTILGGIRMDGLDRLRVTIRIEVINRKFEHYQNNAELSSFAGKPQLRFIQRCPTGASVPSTTIS